MRFTIGLPTDHVGHADEFVTGDAVMECAAAAEAAGFDACFVTDHPAPDSKWLAGGGHHALDPFVALSFAAAATTRLRVQTHILVLPYRNPLLTAKSVLSLDVLSGGRVILGRRVGLPQTRVRGAGRRLRRAQRAHRRGDRRDAARVDRGRSRGRGEALPDARHLDAAPPPATAGPAHLDRRQQHRRDPAGRRNAGKVGFRSRIPAVSLHECARRSCRTSTSSARRMQILRDHAAEIGRTEPIDVCFSPFAEGASKIVDELHDARIAGRDVGGAARSAREDEARVDRRHPPGRRRDRRSLSRLTRPELVAGPERGQRRLLHAPQSGAAPDGAEFLGGALASARRKGEHQRVG